MSTAAFCHGACVVLTLFLMADSFVWIAVLRGEIRKILREHGVRTDQFRVRVPLDAALAIDAINTKILSFGVAIIACIASVGLNGYWLHRSM